MADKILTQERLKSLLSYNAQTGEFTRLTRPANRVNVGSVAGGKVSGGYVLICIDSKQYYAHRLVWLYIHGEWPVDMIDHINGNTLDNRISNLRDVPQTLNQQNRITPRKDSLSKLMGVKSDVRRGVYRALISIAGKRINLGVFNTEKEAHDAYVVAKSMVHAGSVSR